VTSEDQRFAGAFRAVFAAFFVLLPAAVFRGADFREADLVRAAFFGAALPVFAMVAFLRDAISGA
jgi:hypothetical protein